MSKEKKIEKLLSKTFLKEAEVTPSERSKEVFDLLDEARKALQDAQANIYIQMPNMYQQAYKAELDSIYNHCGQAIAEIQVLAKKIHGEVGV